MAQKRFYRYSTEEDYQNDVDSLPIPHIAKVGDDIRIETELPQTVKRVDIEKNSNVKINGISYVNGHRYEDNINFETLYNRIIIIRKNWLGFIFQSDADNFKFGTFDLNKIENVRLNQMIVPIQKTYTCDANSLIDVDMDSLVENCIISPSNTCTVKIKIKKGITELPKYFFRDASKSVQTLYVELPKSIRFSYNESLPTLRDNMVKHILFEDINTLYKITYEDSTCNPAFTHNNTGKSYIYNGSFNNEVTKIIVPEGIEKLDRTFINFTNVKVITLPKTLKYIGIGVFRACGIEEITIPDNCDFMENSKEIFMNCKQLTTINLNKPSFIPESCFRGCVKLLHIYYTGTLNEWKAIIKKSNWRDDVPYKCVVHCTDEDISITES